MAKQVNKRFNIEDDTVKFLVIGTSWAAWRPHLILSRRLADDPIRQANERIGDHTSGRCWPKAEVVAIGD